MFKKLLQLKTLLVALLVMTGVGNVWADEELYYTLTPATGSNNSYTGNCDVTIDGITWNIGGNSQQLPWRIGGKSITTTDRAVYSKTAMESAISKVELVVGAASSITVNSLKLIVASDANFNTKIDEVTATFAANSTITFTPSSPGVEWSTGAYYKFVFNVTVSGSSNKFVEFKSAKFYHQVATLENSDLAITNAPVALNFDLYNNGNAQTVTYTTSSTGAVSVSGGTDYVTTSLNGDTKTITVTPTAVTPSPQTITISQEADATYKAGSVTFTVNVDDSTPVPTHTATFSVNGVTSTQDFEEGASIIFPEDPADINGKTFVGWVTTQISGITDTAPSSFVTSATMGTNNVTYYAVFAKREVDMSTVTDELNRALTGVTGTSYSHWSGKQSNSAAVYTGQSAGGNSSIQLRSTSPSGIITTASGGTLSKVTVTWNSNTSASRKLNVYGSNTAYKAAADLYDSSKQGTLLGTIVYNTSTELEVNDDYAYVGLRSADGAMYLDKVDITWSVSSNTYSAYCTSVIEAPTASVAACEFDTPFDVTITSETGTTLKYTTDGTDPAEGTAVATNSVVLSIPAATTRVRAIALLNGASSPELDVTYTYNPKVAPTLTVLASVDLKVNETGKTITVTTNSDGAVTFESSDDNHLLVNNDTDNKVGELLADAEGTYTVTVTVAETENFRSATADVTVNVTKTTTTLTIDATGLKNTDVYVSTPAGSLAATVLDESDEPVEGVTVTWTSSDTEVATIAADGTVTLVAAGTTTLTATYEGDDVYAGSTNTYELTVTDSEPTPIFAKVTDVSALVPGDVITFVNEEAGVALGKIKTNNYGEVSVTIDNDVFESKNIEMLTLVEGYRGDYVPEGESVWAFKNSNDKYLNAPGGTSDNYMKESEDLDTESSAVIRFDADGNATVRFTNYSFDNTSARVIVKYNSSGKLFSCYKSGQNPIQIYKVVTNTPLSVSSAGYATFSSTSALDFTNVEDINAYTATVSGDAISFTRVNKVPANTGLLLRSVKGGAVSTTVPSLTDATDDVTGNAFVAATTDIASLATTDGDFTNYILNNGSSGIGFYKANGQKVGAGKAYLHVSSELATRAYIAFAFDDPETGVAQVETLPQQGVAYDLQGRRINAPKGGLYIINGKKVIVK